MIYIDLPADLNTEDDRGLNIARRSDAVDPAKLSPGAVLVAGASGAWSWAVIDAIEDDYVYFHQISGREASQHGPLITPLPRPA